MLRAILIDCVPPTISRDEQEFRLQEAENLTKTYGGIVLIKKLQRRLIPNYSTFIGSGKLDEIIEENKELKANILIINNELKPHQIYKLGEICRKEKIEVWDRIDLILKIFAKHAETNEARLEIQLASIRHMGPRIFGMGMELSRQGGGIGTKGVGETNTEFMKRHLFKMEQSIRRELEKCKQVRKVHRDARRRKNLKTIGIIGYTNAGKSSLLNALTRKGALAANKLFATLDTRVGKMFLPSTKKPIKLPPPNENETLLHPPTEVLVSDTIGFIQDLPPQLIKSFSSTLEETIDADLLLHVIDINDPKMLMKIKVVNEILAQIDAFHKPTIYVFNKTDQVKTRKFSPLKKEFAEYNPCFISTYTGEGLDTLKQIIASETHALKNQH